MKSFPDPQEHPIVAVMNRRTTIYVVFGLVSIILLAMVSLAMWRSFSNTDAMNKQKRQILNLQTGQRELQKCATCDNVEVTSGALGL